MGNSTVIIPREITLHPKQGQAFMSPKRFIMAIAGGQSGKTLMSGLWMLNEMNRGYGKEGDYLIAVPSYKIWEQGTRKKFEAVLPVGVSKFNQHKMLYQFNNEQELFVRSTDDIESIESMTLRAIWADEFGQMKDGIWEKFQERLAICKGKFMASTKYYFNFSWFKHKIYEPYREGKLPDVDIIQWASSDSPYYPKEEYERAKASLSPELFAIAYEGKIVTMKGLVYKDFIPNHIIPPIGYLVGHPILIGMDFGWASRNAAVFIVKVGDDYIIFDEIYEQNLLMEDFAKKINEIMGTRKGNFIGDKSAAQEIAEMINLGIPVAPYDNSDVGLGIRKITMLLRQGRLKVCKNCVNTIKEFENYHYKEDDTDNVVKERDHLCFTGESIISTLNGYKRIDNIINEDYVLTRKGYKKVEYCGLTGNEKVYKLNTKNHEIIGTYEHPVFMHDGTKKKLGEIKINDKLLDIKILIVMQSAIWKLKLLAKNSKNLMEKFIGYVDYISKGMGKGYIEKFGNIIMEKYQRNIAYTTRIIIEKIIGLKILNYCPINNICVNILLQNELNNIEKISRKQLSKQQNGTGLTQQNLFINGLVKYHGRIENNIQKNVNFVGENIKHLFLLFLNFVIIIARRLHFGHVEEERVLKVKFLNINKVYNLQIKDCHEFIINNILVSNCDSLRYGLSEEIIEYSLAKPEPKNIIQLTDNEKKVYKVKQQRWKRIYSEMNNIYSGTGGYL
jgi:hypothetical protein